MTGPEQEGERDDTDPAIDPDLDYDAAFTALIARFNDDPTEDAAGGPAAPELDEHFEPPDPPPLPRGDRISRAAWSGVLGGPALLLIAALLNGALPSWMVALALLCFAAGFVTLVARMPAERPDDGDDGAVI